MKKLLKNITYILLLLTITSNAAYAQTLESVVNSFLDNQYLNNIGALMEAVSYVAGIFFLIKCVLKLKEHNESKGQVKFFIPVLYFVAAACFLALPTFVNTGIETFGFDQGGQSTFKF